MDIIEQFMNQDGESIVGNLTSKGFSTEQAQSFMPEALSSLMGGLKGLNIQDLLGSGEGEQTQALLGAVDIGGLASKLGIDSNLAGEGLTAIIPGLMSFIKDNPGLSGLVGLMGGESKGGLAGLAKGLFS